MNHLAHFRLAWPSEGLLVGAFLGDFVKGRLQGGFEAEVERGIRLHRAIDAFADSHPVLRNSVRRFEPDFRRFAPIMLDVIFDHFLARAWQDYHDDSLRAFQEAVFRQVLGSELPDDARRVANRMAESRSLERYIEVEFIDRALTHIGSRLSRDNPLDRGIGEFERLEGELRTDFGLFFPQLQTFCRDWRQQHQGHQ